MRRSFITTAAALFVGAFSSLGFAVEIENVVANLTATAKLGESFPSIVSGQELIPVYNTAVYQPTTFYSSGPGAAATTKVVADDTTNIGGGILNEFSFSVVNSNATVAFSARPRVRFWAADGVGGAPGTLIGGFSFNPIVFAANSANTFTTGQTLAVNNIVIPGGAMWWGMLFDNAGGSTATNAQLDQLGQLIAADPALIGTSNANRFWQANANGSNFVSNPLGTDNLNFGGVVPGNMYWEYQVIPEPASLGLLGAGMVMLVSRRRK